MTLGSTDAVATAAESDTTTTRTFITTTYDLFMPGCFFVKPSCSPSQDPQYHDKDPRIRYTCCSEASLVPITSAASTSAVGSAVASAVVCSPGTFGRTGIAGPKGVQCKGPRYIDEVFTAFSGSHRLL